MHPSASSTSLKANTGLQKTRTLRAKSFFVSELHSTCVELVLVLAQRALPSRARSGVLWEYRLFCCVLFCLLSSHPSLGESRSMKGEANPRRLELRARAIVLDEMDFVIQILRNYPYANRQQSNQLCTRNETIATCSSSPTVKRYRPIKSY